MLVCLLERVCIQSQGCAHMHIYMFVCIGSKVFCSQGNVPVINGLFLFFFERKTKNENIDTAELSRFFQKIVFNFKSMKNASAK